MMIETIFACLTALDDFYWGYIGFTAVLLAGIYFSIKSSFYQFRVIGRPIKTLKYIHSQAQKGKGVSPFRLYFASVGGMVGLGNVVGVVTAVMIGGPGALLWLWLAALSGMLIKYAEIYLGMKYREPDGRGGYDGGPMVYLRNAFKGSWLANVLPYVFCGLLVFYSVEIYQFLVVVDTITVTWDFNRYIVLSLYLVLCLWSGLGGVRRLANIASSLMPIFIVLYITLCFYVVICSSWGHPLLIPELLGDVFGSAFTGHAAVGGFAGSGIMMAIQQGTSRAVYSGDLGIGYDSVIQSESCAKYPGVQASLSIFGVLTDMIICTLSILVVLVSGIWQTTIPAFQAVGAVFDQHIIGAQYFMAFVLMAAGYSTVIAYLAVGNKLMQRLFGRAGFWVFAIYSALAFVAFSFAEQEKVLLLMSISGGLLMLTNLSGIWKLRDKLAFRVDQTEEAVGNGEATS